MLTLLPLQPQIALLIPQQAHAFLLITAIAIRVDRIQEGRQLPPALLPLLLSLIHHKGQRSGRLNIGHTDQLIHNSLPRITGLIIG